MFDKTPSLPGLPSSKKVEAAATLLMQHAFAFGRELGISEAQIGKALLMDFQSWKI